MRLNGNYPHKGKNNKKTTILLHWWHVMKEVCLLLLAVNSLRVKQLGRLSNNYHIVFNFNGG